MTRNSTIATIGVYEFDAAGFVGALQDAGVRLLLDIRQRRGVRGPQYAWANSRRLQALVADAGIGYEHHIELAPDTELRQLQYREDDRQGVGKRNRVRLAPEYVREYTHRILDPVALEPLVQRLPGRRDRRADVRRGDRAGVSSLAGGTAAGRTVRIRGDPPRAVP